jgi:hypothetical protein
MSILMPKSILKNNMKIIKEQQNQLHKPTTGSIQIGTVFEYCNELFLKVERNSMVQHTIDASSVIVLRLNGPLAYQMTSFSSECQDIVVYPDSELHVK